MWWFVFVLGCAVLAWVFSAFAEEWRYHYGGENRLARRSARLAWVVLAIIISSPGFYEWPGMTGATVSFDGAGVLRHPFGRFEWPWESTAWLPEDEQWVGVERTLTLMDGSAIREFRFTVFCRVVDPVAYFRVPERRVGFWGQEGVHRQFVTRLDSLLFEFARAKQAEFPAFYNPRDQTQQVRFGEVVREFVNPVFAPDGVMVSTVEFEVVED